MSETLKKIDKMLTDSPIFLFMKGNPEFPMCGFSARATAILQDLEVPFMGINILEDQELREGELYVSLSR